MAAKPGLTIEVGRGTLEFQKWALAFSGNLDKAITQALKKCVLFVQAEIIRRVIRKDYEPLSALTAWKRKAEGHNTTPLQKTGALTRAITTEVRGRVGSVGVKRQGRTSGGGEFANVARLLHDGGTIRITNKMRAAFVRRLMALSKKTNSVPPERQGDGRVIRIKPRRFISQVFEDRAVQAKIQKIFEAEIEKAIAGKGVRRK